MYSYQISSVVYDSKGLLLNHITSFVGLAMPLLHVFFISEPKWKNSPYFVVVEEMVGLRGEGRKRAYSGQCDISAHWPKHGTGTWPSRVNGVALYNFHLGKSSLEIAQNSLNIIYFSDLSEVASLNFNLLKL